MASMKKNTSKPKNIDPSVYLYDEVYEEIKQESSILGRNKGLNQFGDNADNSRPKYIDGLLRNAELRKKNNERRLFRRYARELEDEEFKDEFKDKETFVTSSYKTKLKDIKKIEQEQEIKRKDEEEKMSRLQGILNKGCIEQTTVRLDKGHRSEENQVESSNSENDLDPENSSSKAISRFENSKKLKLDNGFEEDEVPVNPEYKPENRKKLLEEKLTKRTVGKIFEDAVARYLIRKYIRYSDPKLTS